MKQINFQWAEKYRAQRQTDRQKKKNTSKKSIASLADHWRIFSCIFNLVQTKRVVCVCVSVLPSSAHSSAPLWFWLFLGKQQGSHRLPHPLSLCGWCVPTPPSAEPAPARTYSPHNTHTTITTSLQSKILHGITHLKVLGTNPENAWLAGSVPTKITGYCNI